MTPNPSIERTMTETLPIWRDGAAKCAITDFVARVCREGSPEFVAPPARIAVFDNEGKPVAIKEQTEFTEVFNSLCFLCCLL